MMPFAGGVVSPLFLPTQSAEICFTVGLAWILGFQFYLHRRVNAMMEARGLPAPLFCHWAFVPGLNVVVGLRGIHFLSEMFGAERGSDPLAEVLPWITAPTLTARELLLEPRNWVKL